MTTSVTAMCVDMYILSKRQNIDDLLRICVGSSAVIVEYFLVYGLPAQLLMDESLATGDTIYFDCEWYLPTVRPLRTDLLIMIMQSQKKLRIRAANYHTVSNETPLLILKTAYSFYAFLQKVGG
uniref:Odorant receptor 4 n=1 Tax=Apriona germarii TaxID=157307 RepID=A0A7H9SLJ1_APRGE|nr:odorant receptor 4 [Apriona germarii]